jgi:hypothetical protein
MHAYRILRTPKELGPPHNKIDGKIRRIQLFRFSHLMRHLLAHGLVVEKWIKTNQQVLVGRVENW